MPETERQLVVDHTLGDGVIVSLRTERGSVRVRGVDGAVCHIEARYRVPAGIDPRSDPGLDRVVGIDQSANKLRIEVFERAAGRGLTGKLGRIAGNGRATVDFDVLLPRHAELHLSGVTADLRVHGVQADLEIRTVSGPVRIDDAAGRVSIKTVSANAELQGTDMDVTASTTSGDLSVDGQRLEQVQLATVSGDIRVRGRLAAGPRHTVQSVSGQLTLAPFGGVTVNVRGVSGSVHASAPVVQQMRNGNRLVVVGDGAADLDFRTISGDLEVVQSEITAGDHPDAVTDRVAMAPDAPLTPPGSDAGSAHQLAVLHALERGEIDVDEATRRLAGSSLHA